MSALVSELEVPFEGLLSAKGRSHGLDLLLCYMLRLGVHEMIKLEREVSFGVAQAALHLEPLLCLTHQC